MNVARQIDRQFPELGRRLGRETLATLPTPVRHVAFRLGTQQLRIAIKCDDLTSTLYGGNKIRKLEYLLWPPRVYNKRRIATFGAVGSNHALATATHARELGYDCTCFLVHQQRSDAVRKTLLAHLALGTEIVRFGGGRHKRIATLRKHLRSRQAWVIPAGGSSWLGTVGFVNAGLELAAQIDAGILDVPDRVYIATGTLGSATGLAIGLALADLPTRVEAVRVSMTHIANEQKMQQLVQTTVAMMRRLDSSIPLDIVARIRLRMRHDFFAGGYAQWDEETATAIALARDQLGIRLEGTYTGKAMAAMLHDLRADPEESMLFWNTYNSADITVPDSPPDIDVLPGEFLRYVD